MFNLIGMNISLKYPYNADLENLHKPEEPDKLVLAYEPLFFNITYASGIKKYTK